MRIRTGPWAAAMLALTGAAGGATFAAPTTNPSAPADRSVERRPVALANFQEEAPPPAPRLPSVQAPTTAPAAVPATPPSPEPAAQPASPSSAVPQTERVFSETPTTEGAAAEAQPATPGSLGRTVIRSSLDQERDQIAPSLGATTYTITPAQIQTIPEGQDAPFQQVLLRAPDVVEDSFGQEHVRGEHANLTYRVNGVILPEPTAFFGQVIDTHLINTVTLVDGSLPAQYGFRTAGIVDIQTKTGENLTNNEISLEGGSFGTFEPSASVGGTAGSWDYFVTGTYRRSDLGIENPTSNRTPIHDTTEQTHAFAYLAYHIDDTSRVSFLLNGSYANFQIPNTPRIPQAFALAGVPVFNSRDLNENQNEQSYYDVVSYQKSVDKLSFQASAYVSYGKIHFTPDPAGDLIFNGVASDVAQDSVAEGLQVDASYEANDQHTIRVGGIGSYTLERSNSNTLVFPTDITGAPTSDIPFSISDNVHNHALGYGIYAQDEWRINPSLTFNYGARFDIFDASFDEENQLSPRANLVWKIDPATTAHVGYARYFVPPPVQFTPQKSVLKFNGTTNASENVLADPPKVERSNYYDIGISHQITRPWVVNVDAFYKDSHNLVDLGQFGQAVIFSPFNYKHGYDYGVEFSTTYTQNPWSAYGNFAWVETGGKDINSQQFQLGNDELAFIQNHFIKLDHESEFTASMGVSYNITRDDLAYADLLYGSGLRSGFVNMDHTPEYYPLNVGYQHIFHTGDPRDVVKLRFDVINVADQVYKLRDGSGIGVGAPQFGQRRTFLVGLSYDF